MHDALRHVALWRHKNKMALLSYSAELLLFFVFIWLEHAKRKSWCRYLCFWVNEFENL